jgi:hypothetical protein
MAFANFLVDHENHGAAHFKAAKFIATVKRELLIPNPVQALFVARELACVRQDGIVIHDANAANVCRTDLDHEHFGTVRQAEFTRQAFIDAEKTFETNPNLVKKVDKNGDFLPFMGNTVVYDLDWDVKQSLTALQDELYEGGGALLSRRLEPATFHMTLHDLVNGPPQTPGLVQRMDETGAQAKA